MPDVFKTIVKVTILHTADEDVSSVPLAVIGHEIDEGDWLGQYEVVSSEPVKADKLVDEQVALGNDGTFFNTEDNDD